MQTANRIVLLKKLTRSAYGCGGKVVTNISFMEQDMNEEKRSEGLLTVKETARALHISERTLHNLSEIPRVRIGRSVRFDPKDIAEFVESRKSVAR